MRLLQLELKRVLKTRVTYLLLAAALVLAVVMAYIPVTFIGWTELDAAGNEVHYTGLAAIQKRKEHQVSGVITTDIMKEGLEAYQRVYAEYDAKNINSIPAEVFYAELSQYQPFVNDLKEAFADQETGIAPGIKELTLDDADAFYDHLPLRLTSVVRMESEDYPAAQSAAIALALKKFERVQTPYTYYFGATADSMDYETLLFLLVTLLCAVIAAPVFSADAQTGAEDILLCTRHGQRRLTAVKLGSALLITSAAYLLCGVIWIVTTNSLFGWEGTKTSIQWLFSVTSLLPFNVGQMQWINYLGVFVLFAAEITFVLAASAWAKNNLTAMTASLGSVLLPLIVYLMLPERLNSWAEALLPGSGIGLSNALLYRMYNFDFFLLGDHAWFQADVLLVLAVIKIPLFLALAAWGCRRNVRR